MTAPAPSFTLSRLNVGGYGVKVWTLKDEGRWTEAYRNVEAAWSAQFYKGDVLATRREMTRSFYHPPRGGTVNLDGALAVEPEPWRARHYRRAVMAGAGVYRLGLWAFLAAQRGVTFTASALGAGVEPHMVTVRGFVWRHALVLGTRKERGEWVTRMKSEPVLWCTAEVGEATPDSFTPGRHFWRDVPHRRAVMSGAGVYLMGLWAHLAARRTPDAQGKAGAALGWNDVGTSERFRWAAHGKVRPSVRWKTGRKVRRARKFKVMDWVRDVALSVARQAAGLKGITGRPADRSAKGRRKAEREYAQEYLEERLRHLAPAWADEDNPHGIDNDLISFLDAELSAVRMGYGGPEMWASGPQPDRYLPYLLAYARAIGDKWGLVEVVAAMRFQRFTFAALLVRLERAAYRAHLTRRVRPVSRRTRAPRPLYARPRPPTAPLAPPAL